MAIKVGGAEVINNSRVLQNISGIDAGSITNLQTAGLGKSTTVITYDNKDTLRTTVESDGATALVLGIGIFVYVEGSKRFDDGEFAFAVTGQNACWELQAISWDVVYSYIVDLYGLLPEAGGPAPLTVIEYGQLISGYTSVGDLGNYSLSLGVTVDASKGEQIIISYASLPPSSSSNVVSMYPAIDGATKLAYAVFVNQHTSNISNFYPKINWMKVRVHS